MKQRFILHHNFGLWAAKCLPFKFFFLFSLTLPSKRNTDLCGICMKGAVPADSTIKSVCYLRKRLLDERERIKMYKRKETGCCRCQGPICMNGKGLNCRGWGSLPPHCLFTLFFWGGTKKGVVMPMTAPHSADRDQWLMKGFGSPPGISHSLPP